MKATVRFDVEFTVEVPDDLVERVFAPPLRNLDEHGVPQPDVSGGTGWRNMLYPLRTPEQVIEHIAFNFGFNGVNRIGQLDGWADLDDDERRYDVTVDRPEILGTETDVSQGWQILQTLMEA